MNFRLNEAPFSLIEVFVASNKQLKSYVDLTLEGVKFSVWPNHIRVIQDQSASHYVCLLAKLLLEPNEINTKSNADISVLIQWQARETYRIINAAISSTKIKESLKAALLNFQKHLEMSDEVSSLLMEIEKDYIKADIVCSGHGGAQVKFGYVKNLGKQNVELVLYAGVGSTTNDLLGIAIENQLYQQSTVQVVNDKDLSSSLASSNLFSSFPKVLTGNSLECVPNFLLEGDEEENTKARVIQIATGRVLEETSKGIYLEEIINRYPNRRIHWAACSQLLYQNQVNSTSDSNAIMLGPYKHHFWKKLRTSKLNPQQKISKPTHYHRFHKPALKRLIANDLELPIEKNSMLKRTPS